VSTKTVKRLAAALASLLVVCAHSSAQQSSDEVLRVDTSLVVVPVRVVDSHGRFVSDLKKSNFRVFEDQAEQEIAHFETDNAPFTVALILDVSESTSYKLKQIQEAAITFLNQLRPGDKAIVFTFDANLVKIYEGQTKDLENLRTSIRLTHSGQGTSLYDTVDQIVDNYLNKVNQRKKAIILFTDGVDTSSRTSTYEKSLRGAQESNALIYSIQYDTLTDDRQNASFGANVNIVTPSGEPLSVAYKRATMYLKFLAANSGGRFYLADNIDNLARTFAQIAAELSEQYSLSYYPRNEIADGKKRHIKIQIDVPGAKVVTRKTYTLRSSHP